MFFLDALQRAIDVATNAIVAIPLDNPFAFIYIIGNLILQLLFFGNDPTGGFNIGL